MRSHHVRIPLSGEYRIDNRAFPGKEVAASACSQLASDSVSPPGLSSDTARFLEQAPALSGTGSSFYLLHYSQEGRSRNDFNRRAIAAARGSLRPFAATNKRERDSRTSRRNWPSRD